MEYRFLGRTGLKVSELCLGAMPFGKETDDATAHQMLDRFAELGGTFIDTADAYGAGASEEILGRWLGRRSRDELVIATKAYLRMGSGTNDEGAGRKHLLSAVEASLRRLRTDYIDLYQIHVFDDATPIEETLSTLDGLVCSGKVRFLGASNYAGWQLQKSIDVARHHGWEPFTCLQPVYNLLEREAEWDLVPVSLNEGVGFIPRSPLRGGWLSGRFQRDMQAPPIDTRLHADAEAGGNAWEALKADDRAWAVIDAVAEVAEATGRSPVQVALRWLMQRPGVTAPIIGPRTLDHLDDNLAAVDNPLSDEHMDRLTTVGDRPLPPPYGLQSRFKRR